VANNSQSQNSQIEILKTTFTILFLAALFCCPSKKVEAGASQVGRYCGESCLNSLREFTSHSLSSLEGIPLYLPAEAFGSPDPQRIFLLTSLQKPQVDLVKKLAALSVDPKFVRTKTNVEQGVDQVEVGAFRIILQDGREIYDVHTSQEADGISKEEINSSLQRLLDTKGLQLRDVTLLEYYHTHPWVTSVEGGLSSFDANFIKTWLIPKIKSLNHGHCPAVNLYAISRTLDQYFFVYESSY